jgi:hypothetical protein
MSAKTVRSGEKAARIIIGRSAPMGRIRINLSPLGRQFGQGF